MQILTPQFCKLRENVREGVWQYIEKEKERMTIYRKAIYFSSVNTKYISSSVLKTSEFSRVRSMSENSDVFNSRDEIYLVFTEKKSKFSFYFIVFRRFTGRC